MPTARATRFPAPPPMQVELPLAELLDLIDQDLDLDLDRVDRAGNTARRFEPLESTRARRGPRFEP
jgi:hypothetical protein